LVNFVVYNFEKSTQNAIKAVYKEPYIDCGMFFGNNVVIPKLIFF
jgi:hypothetical protein